MQFLSLRNTEETSEELPNRHWPFRSWSTGNSFMSSFGFDFLHFPRKLWAFHSRLSVNWIKRFSLKPKYKMCCVFDQPIGRFVYFFVRCENFALNHNERRLRADPSYRSVIKEFAHAFSSAYIELWMHLGSLESTQKARVALGCASSYSYAFFVLSKLPACTHN